MIKISEKQVSKKCILILGAGINQLELIREAKKLGVKSVVIDPEKDPPGKYEADFFYTVAGNDYAATREIALRHHAKGIVTGQMEKPMRLMAKLAEEMGYIFHSPQVVERSLDKWLMKKAFVKHSIPCAKGVFIKEGETFHEKIRKLKFPLIVKPKDAFSSRGVSRVDKVEEISAKIEQALNFTGTKQVILEEFLKGNEISVETITWQGKTKVIQFTQKFITPYPFTVEMGHLQPAALSKDEQQSVENLVISAIKAIGIDNSASHAEVMLTENGPYMIEIGARLGGDFIASYLTKASTGISMDKAALQMALGMEPDLRETHKQFSYIRYLELPVNKKVISIDFQDHSNDPDVVFSHIFIMEGETTQPIIHSGFRPACIIVKGNSIKEVEHKAEKYLSLLKNKIKFI